MVVWTQRNSSRLDGEYALFGIEATETIMGIDYVRRTKVEDVLLN
jgi:hypothetical protein